LAGIVAIDFIDVSTEEDKIEIFTVFKAAMSIDKAKQEILNLNDFCVLIMSRQRGSGTAYTCTDEGDFQEGEQQSHDNENIKIQIISDLILNNVIDYMCDAINKLLLSQNNDTVHDKTLKNLSHQDIYNFKHTEKTKSLNIFGAILIKCSANTIIYICNYRRQMISDIEKTFNVTMIFETLLKQEKNLAKTDNTHLPQYQIKEINTQHNHSSDCIFVSKVHREYNICYMFGNAIKGKTMTNLQMFEKIHDFLSNFLQQEQQKQSCLKTKIYKSTTCDTEIN
jgi:hypothetical protein